MQLPLIPLPVIKVFTAKSVTNFMELVSWRTWNVSKVNGAT